MGFKDCMSVCQKAGSRESPLWCRCQRLAGESFNRMQVAMHGQHCRPLFTSRACARGLRLFHALPRSNLVKKHWRWSYLFARMRVSYTSEILASRSTHTKIQSHKDWTRECACATTSSKIDITLRSGSFTSSGVPRSRGARGSRIFVPPLHACWVVTVFIPAEKNIDIHWH